jgi:2-succinyl-5-enolpyruvyl-6-hydroxy-3-cyclohexene-1-carboxylate synthase
MYSNKKNVLQLIALLKAHGICQIVLSPGSRNSPLSHSFAADSFFTCHVVVDERSAGFYAIGVILHTGMPAAVCCTSGTAALNLSSPAAEAFYQQIPLLVITADRPAAWIGQMAGQTLPQPGMYNALVRKSVQLPEINTPEDEWYANRLLNEALLELNRRGAAPVHINIPLSEPLFEFTAEALPDARRIRRYAPGAKLDGATGKEGFHTRFQKYPKKMIIAGQLSRPDGEICALIEKLARRNDCIILGECLSNISSPCVICNFDSILYALTPEEQKAYSPDLLITFGGHIVSKRIKQFLQTNKPEEHWHISPAGEIMDVYQSLAHCIETEVSVFLDYLAASGGGEDTDMDKPYARLWESARKKRTPNDGDVGEFSDLLVVKELLEAAPEDAAIHLANSSSVRLAQLFPFKRGVTVYCNRGTSGIDGCLSTAVGYAAVSKKQTFLLIGDLAFFYDMNGLWNRQLSKNLRILLNNNGGGEIFYALPGLNRSEALETYISASHQTQARAWAQATGFTYLSARGRDELKKAIPVFTSRKGDKPILLEAFTSMEKNTGILRNYYHKLKKK